jgi:uncharacterized protein (DUF1330 family)
VKTTLTVALALVAGFALGAGAIHVLHAQATKKPAYLVAEVKVTDPAGFQAYLAKVGPTLKPYGARYIARGKPDVKEGAAAQGNIVMVEFPSMADAEKWYSTPPYKDLIPLRQKAADTRLYFVEGLTQ